MKLDSLLLKTISKSFKLVNGRSLTKCRTLLSAALCNCTDCSPMKLALCIMFILGPIVDRSARGFGTEGMQ